MSEVFIINLDADSASLLQNNMDIETINPKLILGVLGAGITLWAYILYIKGVFAGRNEPHIYSWLIWAITIGTAAAGILYSGEVLGSLALVASALLSTCITLLAIKYGTKNITRLDTVTLLAAFLAIVVWWQLNDPILAIIMVMLIDAAGFLPTYRKTWSEPESEDSTFWFLIAIGGTLTLIAASKYSFLASGFLIAYILLNLGVGLVAQYKK